MENEPRSRQEILDAFRRSYADFDSALARLTDRQMLATGPGGGWSARDVLAHIAADQRWISGQLQAVLEGREPTVAECYGDVLPPGPEHDLATQDGRNRLQWEQNRHLSLAQVRSNHIEFRARLERILEHIPDDEMERPYAIAMLGSVGQVRPAREGEQGYPLWQWLRGSTWHHFQAHLPDLLAAASR